MFDLPQTPEAWAAELRLWVKIALYALFFGAIVMGTVMS